MISAPKLPSLVCLHCIIASQCLSEDMGRLGTTCCAILLNSYLRAYFLLLNFYFTLWSVLYSHFIMLRSHGPTYIEGNVFNEHECGVADGLLTLLDPTLITLPNVPFFLSNRSGTHSPKMPKKSRGRQFRPKTRFKTTKEKTSHQAVRICDTLFTLISCGTLVCYWMYLYFCFREQLKLHLYFTRLNHLTTMRQNLFKNLSLRWVMDR